MACITSVGVALLILSAGCVESADKTNVEVEIVDPVERVLSSGARHACAILEDGGTQCWGSNDRRQLGHDAMPVANAPLPVLGVPAFVEVAAGDSHTCGRTGAGEVFCWGGRHGLAKRLIEVSNAKRIASGGSRSCVIADERISCWRYDRQTVLLEELEGIDRPADISVGKDHMCALASTGRIYCWGANNYGQVGDRTETFRAFPTEISAPFRATQIACGKTHTCARSRGSRAYCWGQNQAGQLGRASGGQSTHPLIVPELTDVAQVVTGDLFTCVRKTDGSVSCWGASENGRFADAQIGEASDILGMNTLKNVVQLSAGSAHACARTEDGAVTCWGGNSAGELGTGPRKFRPLPHTVTQAGQVAEIVVGATHTCARYESGKVRCWGLNSNWQLGNKTDTARVARPIAVRDITTATQITAGSKHSCARLEDGTVACWGANGRGQMGDRSRERRTRSRPTPHLRDIVHVEAGRSHTCALHESGSVSCWGDNRYGQLGDGSRNLRTRPVQVRGISAAIGIATADKHSCAHLRDGTVACWGSNERGALGLKRGRFRAKPVKVQGLEHVVELRSRGARTCARTETGAIFCWGDGKRAPRLIGTYQDIEEFGVGIAHLCARMKNGTIRCSGSNYRGQIGDGTRTLRRDLSPTTGISDSRQLATGRRFNCSLTTAGAVQCWGDNTFKQLGYAADAVPAKPQRIVFSTAE